MSELKITLERALSAYKVASGDTQKVLEELFGKHVLCPDPMKWVKTFDDVCKAAGVDSSNYVVPVSGSNQEKATMYLKRLFLIADVFNGGWKPNLADTSQRKYYPWFKIYPDTTKPSGFGLSYSVCDCGSARSTLGVRPYFKDDKTAVYVGQQFLDEFEGWAQYENLCNQ